jgi:hypothetical protein
MNKLNIIITIIMCEIKCFSDTVSKVIFQIKNTFKKKNRRRNLTKKQKKTKIFSLLSGVTRTELTFPKISNPGKNGKCDIGKIGDVIEDGDRIELTLLLPD